MKKTPEKEEITLKNETKHNFIIVYETIYKRNDITADEMLLLIKLISMAPTFKPTFEKLKDILKLGKKALTKAIKGLKEKGFLTIKKYGRESQWIITQDPILNTIKSFNTDSIVNALIDFKIDMRDVKELHKRKIIDDIQFIKIRDKFSEELKNTLNTDWLYRD